MSDNGFKKQEVIVEELEVPPGDGAHGRGLWTEELSVTADKLVDTVKGLARESNVRRIVVKNKDGRVLISIPLWLGLGAIWWAPLYSALTIITALATEHDLLVERSETP